MKKPKLGSGKRFKKMSSNLQEREGYDKEIADAVAAKIGRNKFGKKKMADMAAAGRKPKVKTNREGLNE